MDGDFYLNGIDIGFNIEPKIYLHLRNGKEISFNPELIKIDKDEYGSVISEVCGKVNVRVVEKEEDIVDAIHRAKILKMVARESIYNASKEMEE